MATYIPRTEDAIPLVIRENQDQEFEQGPNEVTSFIEQMDNQPEATGLIPQYRVFTPTNAELNRFNTVVNTPNTYTFFRDSGLTISFYLCNHTNLGLVMIYKMGDTIGWYRVDINNLIG